jgi:hypothetical protein
MWEPALVLKRRVPRVLTTGFLLVVAVTGLSGCRTSPNVAAYVGDERVTVEELDAAVDERLDDPGLAEFAERDEAGYTRRVLSYLVNERVYAEAVERYGVRVDEDDVRARIDEILGNDDPDLVFTQLAARGLGRADAFESVRQQLIRQALAPEGGADAPGEEALRARYGEIRNSLGEYSFGYIATPDAAAAQAVLDRLTADPASYAALAAQYPDALTMSALTSRAEAELAQLPAQLVEGITTAAPNTGFTVPGPDPGQVVVVFVAGTVYPPFEEVRPQLEQEAEETADAAGTEVVEDVRSDLRVRLNPRFDVPGEDGVVDILEDDGTSGRPGEQGSPPGE